VSRTQAVGVVLVALGLIYAVLYAAWLRKRRRHTSAAVAVADAPAPALAGTDRLTVEGTYVSTTTAASRHERVAVAGLGNRARATMTVRRAEPDELVRFDRQGESAVVVPGGRLLQVRRDRGMAGKFVGSARLLVLQWRADDGAIYETGFLPRYRADLDRVEGALWWHQQQGDASDAWRPATGTTPTGTTPTGATPTGATPTGTTAHETTTTDAATTAEGEPTT
jgi:hypothetical protein